MPTAYERDGDTYWSRQQTGASVDTWCRLTWSRGPSMQLVPSQWAASVSVARVFRGRRRYDELPQPATLAATIALSHLPQPGDRLDLLLQVPGMASGMFLGEVTSVTVSAGPSVATVPDLVEVGGYVPAARVGVDAAPVVTVSAVDQMARVWRRVIGTSPWPVEDPSERAQRILAAAQAGLTTDQYSDTASGDLDVLAQDVDSRPAGELLDKLMVDTGAIIYLDNIGQWRYVAPNRRASTAVSAVLPASAIVGPVTWTADDGEKVTRARIGWGTANPQAYEEVIHSRAEVYGTDGTSIDPREVRLGTRLATAAAARQAAETLVGSRSLPLWRMSPLQVSMRALWLRDPAVGAAVANLRPEQVVEVVGLPLPPVTDNPGPSASGRYWVMGTEDLIEGPTWMRTLWLEPYGRLADSGRWSDVPSSVRWDQVPAWVTWLTAREWVPYQSMQAWNRLRADLRWTQTGTTTWTTADTLVPPA